jgi:hypothetical protein
MILGKRIIPALILALVIWVPPALADDLTSDQKQLLDRFFQLVDHNDYKESYRLVADEVKKSTSDRDWYGHLVSDRESMGQAEKRTLAGTSTVDKVADLPRGNYLLVSYDTVFSKHPVSQEEVYLVEGADGRPALAWYRVQYNRWPEAGRIIVNGIVLVFFIMGLLSGLTYGVGRVVQRWEARKKTDEKKEG